MTTVINTTMTPEGCLLSVKSDTIPQLIKECNQYSGIKYYIEKHITFYQHLININSFDMRWVLDSKLHSGVSRLYRHPYSRAMRIRYCDEVQSIINEINRKLNRAYVLEMPHQVDIYGRYDNDE